MFPDGKIPPFTLIEGRKGITDKLKQFMLMKNLDAGNEKWQGPRRSTMEHLSSALKSKGGLYDDFSTSQNPYELLKNAILAQESRRRTLP